MQQIKTSPDLSDCFMLTMCNTTTTCSKGGSSLDMQTYNNTVMVPSVIYYNNLLFPPLQEFQKAFTDEKGLFLKSSPTSGQDPVHRQMDETLSIPLAIEQ